MTTPPRRVPAAADAAKSYTAAECYAKRRERVEALLREVQRKLDAYHREAALRPLDWSYPGTLDRVIGWLTESSKALE